MTDDATPSLERPDAEPSILQAVMETCLDGVLVVDEDREYVLWNEQFVDMWGVPQEYLGDQPEAVALDWVVRQLEDPEEFIAKVEYLYAHPEEESRETVELADGRCFDRYSAPVRVDDGSYLGRVWFFRDVTDTKRYQDQLEDTKAKLEAMNRMVRHDIRNDMNVILGWAEMLEAYVTADGEPYLEKIQRSGNHIVELTDITRDYVETVTGDARSQLRPTPLRSVLRTEVYLRQETFPDAQIEIRGDIPDVDVTANEMLSSVFRNLLTNAVQHNHGPDPVVEVSADLEADAVVVRVADNGPGIPDDRKESIFGKGEKGLASTGTGIGLHLVQTLVSDYGGAVWVDDNDPTGSIFTVRVPRAER